MDQYKEFAGSLNNNYQKYREESLVRRRFKHSEILPLINGLKENALFTVKQTGSSAQGREIYLISLGKGKTKVFLWSQMHGDESTATMALFDICNFFMGSDQLDDFRKDILNNLTIYFIPMVNPDGAELFERRNSMQIDINRDALKQQSPEAKILTDTFNSLKADFGFNLHDQSIYYSAGRTANSASVSFLAPPADYDKSVSPVRRKSMQLIGFIGNILKDFIPGHIGRYTDDYEPRAFGDTFQSLGTSTVLVETGGWKNDPEKQFLRKLSFIILLASFKAIAEKTYLNEDPASYEKIPFNQENNMMDLILRNLVFRIDGRSMKADIGINRTEFTDSSAKSYYCIGRVADLGDLSVFGGYEDYDMEGMEISVGKTFEQEITSLSELSGLDFKELYSRGCTNVDAGFAVEKKYSEFPVNIRLKKETVKDKIRVEDPANFIISQKGSVKFVVINGYLVDIKGSSQKNINGEVFR